MITISKQEIKNSYLIDLLGKRHSILAKITLFENRYKKSFNEFEKKLQKKKENFSDWDNYIEWKGYQEALIDIEKKIKDLKNGDFKVT